MEVVEEGQASPRHLDHKAGKLARISTPEAILGEEASEQDRVVPNPKDLAASAGELRIQARYRLRLKVPQAPLDSCPADREESSTKTKIEATDNHLNDLFKDRVKAIRIKAGSWQAALVEKLVELARTRMEAVLWGVSHKTTRFRTRKGLLLAQVNQADLVEVATLVRIKEEAIREWLASRWAVRVIQGSLVHLLQ